MESYKVIPFRWNVDKLNELGSLLDYSSIKLDDEFLGELISSAARILAFSGNAYCYFVGRSPENYFDLLTAAFYEQKNLRDRINLFQFSRGYSTFEELLAQNKTEVESLFSYMKEIGLSPQQILGRKEKTAFIDLVYSGSTFEALLSLYKYWTEREKENWPEVRKKMRIVGITERTKNSPNTWRWQQQADWIDLIGESRVKNVSITYGLWTYLGNHQSKTTLSHHPDKWGKEAAEKPERSTYNREGLQIARKIFLLGRSKKGREELRRQLIKQNEMKFDWFKAYQQALKS
ncbi:MAG: hypothetical protein R8P61_27185 [Bacteroidia bacterium]|nr:hypothetical protein [Bacteroidia bacterium]